MISADRILGFVEGEGCFSIGLMKYIDRKPRITNHAKFKRKKPSLPFRVVPNFRLAIKERDKHLTLDLLLKKEINKYLKK